MLAPIHVRPACMGFAHAVLLTIALLPFKPALAQDAIGRHRMDELLGHLDGFIEHIVKQLELAVEDEKETKRGLVEDRAQTRL